MENQLAWASLTGSCVLRPKALIQIVLMGDRWMGTVWMNPDIWMQSRYTQAVVRATHLPFVLMSCYMPGTSFPCQCAGRIPILGSYPFPTRRSPSCCVEPTWWCSSCALLCFMMFSFSKSSFCCLSNSSLPCCFQHKRPCYLLAVSHLWEQLHWQVYSDPCYPLATSLMSRETLETTD